MLATRVYIIHGWGESPKDAWIPWLKSQLEARGCKVQTPYMPDSEHPRIDLWVGFLDGMCMNSDEKTFFVGHSIGCQTILRYIQILPKNTKVGGVVCVAGWLNLSNLETQEEKDIAEPWIQQPLRMDVIKKNSKAMYALFSDNDPFDCYEENVQGFEKFGATVQTMHNAGHIDSQSKLPEVIRILEKIGACDTVETTH